MIPNCSKRCVMFVNLGGRSLSLVSMVSQEMGRSPHRGMWHVFFLFFLTQEAELEFDQIHSYWAVSQRKDSGWWISPSDRIPLCGKGVVMRTHVSETGSKPVRCKPTTLGRFREPLGRMGASHQDKDVSHELGEVS